MPAKVSTLSHGKKRGRREAVPKKIMLAFSPTGQGTQVAYSRATPCDDAGEHLSRLLPRGSHRFALHSRHSCYIEVLRTEGYSEILRRLSAYLLAHGKPPSLVHQCVILVHEAERYGKNYVDVFWPRDKLTVLSLTTQPRLSLTMEAYIDAKGGSVAPHLISISTWVPKSADMASLTKAVVLALSPSAQVIDISRKYVFLPALNASKWTGHITMLVSVFVPTKAHTAPSEKAQVYADNLPGYVLFMGKSINLHYEHRKPWCSFCKSNATSFHLREDCTRAANSKRSSATCCLEAAG
jgi:hypothetical protein